MKGPKYIIDEQGKKISVILSIDEYNTLLEDIDETYCVKLYDKAVELNESGFPLKDYLKGKANGWIQN